MKLDAVQLMRAADELAKFLYARGARKVRIAFDFGERSSFCAVEAPGLVLPEREVEALRRAFAGPIQPEIAAYYGALAGRRPEDSELELLGTMAELEDLLSTGEVGTRIVLSRREAEFFGSVDP